MVITKLRGLATVHILKLSRSSRKSQTSIRYSNDHFFVLHLLNFTRLLFPLSLLLSPVAASPLIEQLCEKDPALAVSAV